MSAPNDAVPAGSTGTLTIADALRECADWLDAHHDISSQFATVLIEATERGDLERLAEALGDRAREEFEYGRVKIAGLFGMAGRSLRGVRVYGDLPVEKLADAPVKPTYPPILPPEEWQDDLDRQTGEGRR
jgi:hypothetical protein